MSVHPFNPEMLTLARMARGLTQTELAAKAEIAQGGISKIEHGFYVPDDEQVRRFAKVLQYPREFFFQPGVISTLPSWFHRRRKYLPQSTLSRIHAEIAIRILNIVKMLMATEVRAVHPVPEYDADAFDGDVEHIARIVREHWAIKRGPIENLVETLERAGILVVPCDFGASEVDAVAMRLHGMPPLIFMNATAPTDRVRHTMAHELAHLVMHAIPSEDMEKEADRFAAEFLMPALDIRPQLANITLQTLAILKRVWRVSMQALLYRAKTLGTITARRATALWKQMSAEGFRKREPAELDLTPERPRILRELIDFHTKELGMTTDQLLKMFSLHEPDFARFYGAERRTYPLRLVG